MTNTVRRLVLAIGAALLIGGWGMTRYAHEQQMAVSIGAARLNVWDKALVAPPPLPKRPTVPPLPKRPKDVFDTLVPDEFSEFEDANLTTPEVEHMAAFVKYKLDEDARNRARHRAASRTIYAWGVLGMALGAGAIAFAAWPVRTK